MNGWRYLVIILLALAAGYAGSILAGSDEQNTAPKTESAYERVMRTGVLRCGYFVWPPLITKDVNTGALGGLTYDVTAAVAQATELKIEWLSEMAFSTFMADIQSGRYDAECAQGWPSGVRGKYVFYSKPYAYLPMVAVLRFGDTRFAKADAINQPEVKVVAIDGETSQIIKRNRFPQATAHNLPQNTTSADQILAVTSNKADVALVDALTAAAYVQANPDSIKIMSYEPPLHLIALNFTLPQDEKLKNLMDVATQQLLNNGTIETLLQRYEPYPGFFIRAGRD